MKVTLSDIRVPITKIVKDMLIGDTFIQMGVGNQFYGPYRVIEIKDGRRFAINLATNSIAFELDDDKEYTPVDIDTITVKRHWK